MRGEKVPNNGPMLLKKAHSLAIQLNSDFQANPLWLGRLKKRENLSFQKFHGEKRAADTEGAELHNISNADESGLFYKTTPTGLLVDKGEERSGIKFRKEHLSFLMIMNQSRTDDRNKPNNFHAFQHYFSITTPGPGYYPNSESLIQNPAYPSDSYDYR